MAFTIYARTYPAATQKGVADLCLWQRVTMYVQIMHVHKIFLLRIAVDIKAACASSKHDRSKWQFNEHTGIRQFFTHQNFQNPDSSIFSVKILHHTVFVTGFASYAKR